MERSVRGEQPHHIIRGAVLERRRYSTSHTLYSIVTTVEIIFNNSYVAYEFWVWYFCETIRDGFLKLYYDSFL